MTLDEQIAEARHYRATAPTWPDYAFWNGYVADLEELAAEGATVASEPWYRS